MGRLQTTTPEQEDAIVAVRATGASWRKVGRAAGVHATTAQRLVERRVDLQRRIEDERRAAQRREKAQARREARAARKAAAERGNVRPEDHYGVESFRRAAHAEQTSTPPSRYRGPAPKRRSVLTPFFIDPATFSYAGELHGRHRLDTREPRVGLRDPKRPGYTVLVPRERVDEYLAQGYVR